MGKLVVHIVENGHTYKLECDECTLVEAVQKFLESTCGIPFNDQLLLCFNLKLEAQRPLSAYKLPSDVREVFLFNKARMRSNSPHPAPENVGTVDIPDPPLPSSSNDPHPLDDASDPALKALPSYERQFRYQFKLGEAIYNRTSAKIGACERLLQEQKVQERALEIARGNLGHFFKIIHQDYMDFMKCYSQQHRVHTNFLANFGREKEKLRSIKILSPLQTANCKCLLDFVKEENLQKAWENCSSSHKQFENKVSEFKLEFGELKSNAEHIFLDKASFLVKDLELSIKHHRKFIIEQKTIMHDLSKDVNTVKKLMNDCLSCHTSTSLRPHDAVSALGSMYDTHDKTYLPKMQSCEHEISSMLDIFGNKKNEMNTFVHIFMQKIAYTQSTIKNVRYKFSVFHEALNRQNDHFEQLKVVRRIGPAYRACLAEVVRRKASRKTYMAKAGQLAEKLSTERDAEIRRRDEFLRVHSAYVPRDLLESMGLYDIPNPCNVSVAPSDSNLLDIDLSDLERYAPELLLGLSLKSDDHGTSRSSLSPSEIDKEVESVEISNACNMEVENAKLKADLSSKIALICSLSAEFDYETLDDSGIDSLQENAAEKATEALHLKDEYEKRLQSMLRVKQIQCKSYEKRIHELEERLSDHYMRVCNLSADEDVSNFAVSTTMEEALSTSGPLKSGVWAELDNAQEQLDDNMKDSSAVLSPHVDLSMLDLHLGEGYLGSKDQKTTPSPDGGDGERLTLELQNAIADKSSQSADAETNIQELVNESSKLLDESQMNCAHLQNSVHEAREEAQTHVCAAERRASIKMSCLLASLRGCVSSVGVAAFSKSVCALACQSNDQSTDCMRMLADEVGLLSRLRVELLERSSKAEAANEQLSKELEERKEFIHTLYVKHQLENQANKDKISFNELKVHEIAAFVLNSSGHYKAINRSCPHYYLSAESVALFSENLPSLPIYIIGPVLTIQQGVVSSSPSTLDDAETLDEAENQESASNPYGLPVGCEYFVVTIGMLPDSDVPS